MNNELQNLYGIGDDVKHIYQALQPLIKDMPGKGMYKIVWGNENRKSRWPVGDFCNR